MGLMGLLEAAIGLAFVYLLMSVLCSGINEVIAARTRRRGRFLREGLRNMVPDRWIYLRLMNHPLVASQYRSIGGRPAPPSYIPGKSFASALIDTVLAKASQLDPELAARTEAPTVADLRTALLRCRTHGYHVADAVLPLLDAAAGDLDRVRTGIETWFDTTMDRVGGWYKARSQRYLFVIGLIVAVLFNVDTIEIASTLARDAKLRGGLVAAAEKAVESGEIAGIKLVSEDGEPVTLSEEDTLKLAREMIELEQTGLPVGFSCLNPSEKVSDAAGDRGIGAMLGACWKATRESAEGHWVMKIVGWFITALAVSLGATFWFELLNRLVDLRGGGRKPEPAKAK